MKTITLECGAAYEVHRYMDRHHPGARIIRAIPIREGWRIMFVEPR